MRILLKIIAGLVPGLLLASTAISADLVLKNGKFYTVDIARPWADAVAIDNGRIVYVGDDNGVSEFIDADTAVHDLAGRYIFELVQNK
jgi:hypothetical protein